MHDDGQPNDSHEILPTSSQEAGQLVTARGEDAGQDLEHPFPHLAPGVSAHLQHSHSTSIRNYNPLYDQGTAEHLTMLIDRDSKQHEREISLQQYALDANGRKENKVLIGFLFACICIAGTLIFAKEAAPYLTAIICGSGGLGLAGAVVKLFRDDKKAKEDEA